jgi:hypothetical protein
MELGRIWRIQTEPLGTTNLQRIDHYLHTALLKTSCTMFSSSSSSQRVYHPSDFRAAMQREAHESPSEFVPPYFAPPEMHVPWPIPHKDTPRPVKVEAKHPKGSDSDSELIATLAYGDSDASTNNYHMDSETESENVDDWFLPPRCTRALRFPRKRRSPRQSLGPIRARRCRRSTKGL